MLGLKGMIASAETHLNLRGAATYARNIFLSTLLLLMSIIKYKNSRYKIKIVGVLLLLADDKR
jgi:hypothetical protein